MLSGSEEPVPKNRIRDSIHANLYIKHSYYFMQFLIPALLIGCILTSCNCNRNTVKQSIYVKTPQHDLLALKLKPELNMNDTINISTDPKMPAKYAYRDLQSVWKYHPELKDDIFNYPDEAYAIAMTKTCTPIDTADYVDFGSEVGQDDYYVVYAYFLSFKNGRDRYAKQRQTLIALYRNINELMGRLRQGGTYFGHQYSRILGYAEYAISLYKDDEDDKYKKTYSIVRQKQLYIAGLKQMIADDLNNDSDFMDNQKPQLKTDLFKIVNKIEHLITNYYYLRMAQDFQYHNY